MNVFKSLSLEAIQRSSEIQTWLKQFPADSQIIATNMLLCLQFVSRDTYSEWIKKKIDNLPHGKYALYASRKLEGKPFWNTDGTPKMRPASSLGSEDLVSSIIANNCKNSSGKLFDHPSIQELKKK